ncbi:MAG: hypothetical protein Q4Q06_00445 [Bacteroidota bacterium]|nr:hypothetical protein [Bacteroidota bacterium]
MKNIFGKLSLLLFCLCLISMSASALPYKGAKKSTRQRKADGVESCRKAQGSAELSINNVRVRINQGGNMWTDGATAQYYVPKAGNSTALFCSALWIGGMDENDQLRVAAMRFGSEGQDFWPGPLTVDNNASVNRAVCDQWDKLFRITKAEVQEFVSHYATGDHRDYITSAIREWPGNGDESLGQSRFLAPFFDRDGDGVYNPENGDYPYYDFNGDLCPTTIRDSLPVGVPYTPTPTYESTNSDIYQTGGAMKAYNGLLVDQVLKGDETLWWVFNDKGAAHTESNSQYAIGLEIRAQAFAFTMNNEINDMTFYSYEIINRSAFKLKDTYFSQWVDPDLGYAFDDYVGCDVERGLGYCYNGDANDGPGQGAYSGNPPAVGIDFFQGPYMDAKYGKDIPKVDTAALKNLPGGEAALAAYQAIIDKELAAGNLKADINILLTADADKYKEAWFPENGNEDFACAINGVNFGNGIANDERFGMRRFLYYNNSSGDDGEPTKAQHYYNYLRGIWKNNQPMYYGGNGFTTYDGYESNEGIRAEFMFPGDSDIWGWGTPDNRDYGKNHSWSESTADNGNPNPVGDRRFMQSAGPFTLSPGAINYITVGIPFAQAATGGPQASVTLLRKIDDKCQALFDNCFNVLEGPDAPDIVVQELDREIILYLTNESGNNMNEGFRVLDVSIPNDSVDGKLPDRYYTFEGYQIFQLKDATVSVSDVYDNSKAQLVAQCDIKNNISTLINYTTDESGILESQVMVSGANQGIQHTFRVTEDLFSTSTDKRLVNNKKYYFIAIAYAQNMYKEYSPTDVTKIDGQKEPYLASRKKGDGSAVESVVAIPHKLSGQQNGITLGTTYGVSPEITRVEGYGNGGLVINLQKSSVAELMGNVGVEPQTETITINNPYTKQDTTFVTPINIIKEPEYQTNAGPLNVKVVDPLNVKAGSYYLGFKPAEILDTTVTPNVTTYDTNMSNATWFLTTTDGSVLYDDVDTVWSTRPLSEDNEQIVFGLGISISLTNPEAIATTTTRVAIRNFGKEFSSDVRANVLNSGSLLSSGIVYADANKSWLTGFADDDGSESTNWIRSGSLYPSEVVTNVEDLYDPTLDYFCQVPDTSFADDGSILSIGVRPTGLDPLNEYEKCVNGTWAPYRLTSTATQHPAFVRYYYINSSNSTDMALESRSNTALLCNSLLFNDMNNLASVDIVFTSDKSKWTRCPVIEMGTDTTLTQGGAKKFQLRRERSWEKDGTYNPADSGMSWFPGYAINLETGERLNMIFGENSSLGQLNGRDMIWNPPASGSYGGMHFVYVIGTGTHYTVNANSATSSAQLELFSFPAYDGGVTAKAYLRHLDDCDDISSNESIYHFVQVEKLFSSIMWVGTPAASGVFAYGNADPNIVPYSQRVPDLIPTDATVQIRVRKPYSMNWTQSGYNNSVSPINDNFPLYRFGIASDMIPATNVGYTDASSVLDAITVVPNPYYASSLYEGDQVNNTVKITNLPPECYITIYSVDGTVVRKLRGPSKSITPGSGSAQTYIEWDLKNERGLQISGGIYLIHVKADGIGETLVKWFGALRPVDLNSFQ